MRNLDTKTTSAITVTWREVCLKVAYVERLTVIMSNLMRCHLQTDYCHYFPTMTHVCQVSITDLGLRALCFGHLETQLSLASLLTGRRQKTLSTYDFIIHKWHLSALLRGQELGAPRRWSSITEGRRSWRFLSEQQLVVVIQIPSEYIHGD